MAKPGRWKRWLAGAALLVCLIPLIVAVYATEVLAPAFIINAPNRGSPAVARYTPPDRYLSAQGVVGRHARLEVGAPPISASTYVLEPGDRRTIKGSVVLLHGIRNIKESMVGIGRYLRERGYVVVLVDLRGHGKTSGDHMTYGAREARDVKEVVDQLLARKMMVEPVGAIGTSYGAPIAIRLASLDARVKAVVAVAPFSNLRNVMGDYVVGYYPRLGRLIPWFVFDRALSRASRMAPFEPRHTDAMAAARRARAKILLAHGKRDRIVHYRHSVMIRAASPKNVELLTYPHEGHILCAIANPGLRTSIIRWFDRMME